MIWFNLKMFERFFTVRAVRVWNSFPQLVVSARSIGNFKKLASEHNAQEYGK